MCVRSAPVAVLARSYLGRLSDSHMCCVYRRDDEWEADFGCGLIKGLYTQGGLEY